MRRGDENTDFIEVLHQEDAIKHFENVAQWCRKHLILDLFRLIIFFSIYKGDKLNDKNYSLRKIEIV